MSSDIFGILLVKSSRRIFFSPIFLFRAPFSDKYGAVHYEQIVVHPSTILGPP